MKVEPVQHEPTGAIILAAGAAVRMGQLKQLLPYRGKTLLEHALEQAINSKFQPVVVVLGAQAHKLKQLVSVYNIEVVENLAWETGMGSSIVAGMEQLLKGERIPHAVAILVADQPLIGTEHLLAMRGLLDSTEAPIVAAEYNGTVGVPAIFRQDMFAALLALPSEAGARALLRNSATRVTCFPVPEAAADIDTPGDLERVTSEAVARHRT